MAEPLISVVLAVRDGERFLDAALDSVFAQAYEPLEVIVVDDGSTDGSGALAAARGARVIRQAKQGLAAARNAGIRAARGEFIAFIDADDVWVQGKLAAQVACLTAHPEADFVCSHMALDVDPSAEVQRWRDDVEPGEPVVGSIPAALVRKDAFDRVGLFDTSYAFGEDTEWLARAKDAGASYRLLPDVHLRYRRHGENRTNARSAVHGALLRLLRESVDRRREPQ